MGDVVTNTHGFSEEELFALQRQFHHFDKDRNGCITVKEFEFMLRKSKIPVSEESKPYAMSTWAQMCISHELTATI